VYYFDVLSGYSDGDSERNVEDSVHGQPVTLGSVCSIRIKTRNISIAITCIVKITTK
jgi:hypothetical protein